MVFGKKIIILGAGREGISAANFLSGNNDVSIFDDKKENALDQSILKNLKFRPKFFYSSLPKTEKFDLIIRSPGVRIDHPILIRLVKEGSQPTSGMNLFFDLCPCPVIGVTGTKGKGTTSTLIYEMLKSQHPSVFLAGNIGTPALDILPQLNKNSIAVLELSSFQLIDLKYSPHIAVVLMVTEEHLDWHSNVKEYREAKKSIVKFQKVSDFAIINNDYPESKKFINATAAETFAVSTKTKVNGAYLAKGEIVCEIVQREVICKIADVLLPGAHNLENVLAASAVAKLEGIKKENIKNVLKSFKGLEHRLELTRTIRGVKFYNDSYSTTPETSIAAINAFEKNPKILILGGSSKKSNFSSLAKVIIKNKSIKKLVLIGQEAKLIKSAISKAGHFGGEIAENAKNMREIVASAKQSAVSGDIIILSPGCASFDMFKNYQERGNQYKLEVEKL